MQIEEVVRSTSLWTDPIYTGIFIPSNRWAVTFFFLRMKKNQDLRTQIAAYLYGISPPDNPQVKEIRPGAPRNWAMSWGQGHWSVFMLNLSGENLIAVGFPWIFRCLLQKCWKWRLSLFWGKGIWHLKSFNSRGFSWGAWWWYLKWEHTATWLQSLL